MSEAARNGTGEAIAELAERLRARQGLGRSEGLNRLFDYLAARAAEGARPKEFEVAAAVFGRSSAFDGSQDASVRVAVHRLRRKLDDYYAGAGRDEPVRLMIPKGEYRMVAQPRGEAPPEAAVTAGPPPAWKTWASLAAVALVTVNLAVWAAFWVTHRTDQPLREARASAPWGGLLNNGLPTLLVLGKESWASNPQQDGRIAHFRNARVSAYDRAGHWVHHDRLDEFVNEVRTFLA